MTDLHCVADVMTREPITFHEEDDVWEAEQQMSNLGLRHVPVVDDGRLVGLLTRQHLLAFSVSQRSRDSLHRSLDDARKHGTFVADIMERRVITAMPDASLRAAASTLATRKIGCLPVVDRDDRLIGIVTETDLMSALAALLDVGASADEGPQ
jgi:CBS domain-containing protein